MLRTRSRSINFTEPDGVVGERCLAKRISWRTSLLCGMYSKELTSSIFYTMEDEEVYLRESPCRTIEPEVPKQSAPEPNPTATVRHVRMVGKCRRWSMANRTVSSFQRRLQRRVSRKVSGSMDNLRQRQHDSNVGEMQFESTQRVGGEEDDRMVCEAIAVKDCYPSPYDREALAFRRGDQIEVVKMGPTGIWRGRCRGREGNFKFIDVRVEKQSNKQRTMEARSPTRRISRSQSVSDLLSSMSLENLTSVFVLNGYDTAEDIEQLNEEDLEYLGITEEETREMLLDTARHLARRDSALDLDSPSSSTLESPTSTIDSSSSSSSSILDSTSSTADLVSSFADSAISSSVDSSASTGGRVRPSFLHGSCNSYRDSGICVADV